MPLCLKLAATGLETLGLTAGRLYAASTLGSVAGTLLTALWALPTWGTQRSLFFLAAIVWVTGLLGWIGGGRRNLLIVPLLLLCSLLFVQPGSRFTFYLSPLTLPGRSPSE